MNFQRLYDATLLALSGHPRSARFWRITLVLLVVVILVLALIPAPPRPLTLGWDKLNHTAAFASLAGAAFLGFGRQMRARIAAALVGYGALIEVLQSFTPTRSAEWADLAADCLGIALGLLLSTGLAKAAERARRKVSVGNS